MLFSTAPQALQDLRTQCRPVLMPTLSTSTHQIKMIFLAVLRGQLPETRHARLQMWDALQHEARALHHEDVLDAVRTSSQTA